MHQEAGNAPHRALFTPPSIGHAERVAHGLLERYSGKPLTACQHIAALLFGYPDWLTLESAIASGTRASRYDDEERAETVHARREHQSAVGRMHLAGVSDETALVAERLDRELLTGGKHRISQRYDPMYNTKRLERAHYAFNLLYAECTLDEVWPTSRTAAVIPDNDDRIELLWRVELLPVTLRDWLYHHRPGLEHWADTIGKLRVRQRCATELLMFASTWGEFTIEHGATIPHGLQVYPVALSARWYAWLLCDSAPTSSVLGKGAAEAQSPALQAAIREAEMRFLLAQPREDFRAISASAREQQMRAGHTAVRRCMSEASARPAGGWTRSGVSSRTRVPDSVVR